MFASFILSLQFLTRLPLNINIDITDKRLGQSVLFYPIVGLLIGLSLNFIQLLLPAAYALELNAAIILSLWVLLTGGLHLDGLADCTDAWAGGLGDKQRSLDIMKDPAAGPIAVVILLLLLLLKWSALLTILKQENSLTVLLLAPCLGRISILLLMLNTPYVRKNGLGSTLQDTLPKTAAMVISFFGLLLCAELLSVSVLFAALLTIALVRHLALQRLQGVTGDVYGACVEIVETTVLVSWVLTHG